MNLIILVIPLFLIRFALLGLINKDALKRASHFAPLEKTEKTAYYVYQLSNVLIILYSFFLKTKTDMPLFLIALLIYITGIVVLVISTLGFAKPSVSGINTKGIYKFSRNPMYIGYFLYFLGLVLLSRSVILFVLLAIFQASSHWIILAEERWCTAKFGEEYARYMSKVRRYI